MEEMYEINFQDLKEPTPEEFIQGCIDKVENYQHSYLMSEYVAEDALSLAESALRKTAYTVKDFEEYFAKIPELDENIKSQYERMQYWLKSYIHDFEGLTRIELKKWEQERFEAIRDIDLNEKPETNGEKLRQFCKKAMQMHGEGYKDYIADGVKMFLLATPNVKLEQMTKLIDYVAPQAVYNYPEYMPYDLIGQSVYNPRDKNYSEEVKRAVREDSVFRDKLKIARAKSSGVSR